MRHIEITLISYERHQDADGYETLTEKRTEVFGLEKSVSYKEFYKAMESGIKPTLVVAMYRTEWEDAWSGEYAPEHCIVNGIKYRIIREYSTDLYHSELTLAQEVHN